MKSFIVFSDIHGNTSALPVLKGLISENSGGIFAGDGLGAIASLKIGEFYAVKGNCDFSGESEMIFDVEGVKILLTHGHLYRVKSGYLQILYRAKEVGAKVVIFGHTHEPLIAEEDGILMINPGTCSNYSYKKTIAYLVINGNKATAFINDRALN
ncbi:MAG: metallophosphoesterase [Clostridia bacterium]|nr:metallophosphoesterase [Clostridia bacterium]